MRIEYKRQTLRTDHEAEAIDRRYNGEADEAPPEIRWEKLPDIPSLQATHGCLLMIPKQKGSRKE